MFNVRTLQNFVPAQSKGVALISVLLIVAILLAVTSRLMARHNLVINQHQNTFEQNQALQYALGAETLARQALYDDFNVTGVDVDHLGEIWAQQSFPFELDEGGFLEAQLTDLNGCFNLNSVVGGSATEAIDRFKRLATQFNVPTQLVDAWIDWVDSDDTVTNFGAEDREYLIADTPYRTPNTLVIDRSELYLMQNLDRTLLAELWPNICLLPDADSRININTANAATLAALDAAISPSLAQDLVESDRSFASVTEFTDAHPDFAAAANALSVTSTYFQLHAQAQLGNSSVTLQSLMVRDTTTGIVTVLRRDFGKLFRSNVNVDLEET